ncbi:MAG: hypothetical protein ACLT60_04870 [Hominenteromicrobium sp.]|uniref:hypothetical protein n=1 Tax=Hominenteromicrobium sp. TaxID=3073581 RepID=UPI003994C859
MTTQALLQLSADIITRYYNNEIEPFLAACHPDVLWIGPANTQIIRTRETLIETFAEEHHNLRFEMHDLVDRAAHDAQQQGTGGAAVL